MHKLPTDDLLLTVNKIVSTSKTIIKEEETKEKEPGNIAQSVANYINLAKQIRGKVPGSVKANSSSPRTVTNLEQPPALSTNITKASSESISTPTIPPFIQENNSSISKEYYNKLDEALGVNLDAYGRNKKGKKRARRFLERQESHPHSSWSGDSSSVEDLPTERQADGGIDPAAAVKNTVIDLMSKAQTKGIQMTHGEAHRMAMKIHGLG
jgi:hypothetical protein